MGFYSGPFSGCDSSGVGSKPASAYLPASMVSEEDEVERILFSQDGQVYDEPESMVLSSEASPISTPPLLTPATSMLALAGQETCIPTRRDSWLNKVFSQQSIPVELVNVLSGSHLEVCPCEPFRSTSACEDDCQLPRTQVWPSIMNCNLAANPCLATKVLHSFAIFDFWSPLQQTATACGIQLFEYAYDFTRPMLHMGSQFAERLLAHHRVRQRPLIIVAHSLGGLVTLEALAEKSELLPLVAGIICLGSPFEGSADTFVRRKGGFKRIVSGGTVSKWQSLDALEPFRGNTAWRDSITSRTKSYRHLLPPVVAVSCRERKTVICESYLDGEEPVLVKMPTSGDGTVTFDSATTLPLPWPKPHVVITPHGHVQMINQPRVFIDALGSLASLCHLC